MLLRGITSEHLWRHLRRRAAASLRYLRLVASQFSSTFLVIGTLLIVGTLLFHRWEVIDSSGRRPDWGESLFATYALFALQPPYQLPAFWGLRLAYFIYPLIGLAVVAESIVRVSLLLFSRQENQKEWTKVLASTYRDHVILCGLGRVGFRILERLLQYHLDVVVIEKDEGSPFLQKVQRLNIPVLIFDAKQEESLEEAGIRHARALVIATNDDLANVEIALDARRLKPGIRIVLRMFDEGIANKLREAFNLDVAFSSAASAAPMVAASVLELDILNSFDLDGREVFTAKLQVDEDGGLVGRSLADLHREYQVLVVSRGRKGEPPRLGPAPGERLEAGDHLVIHGELDHLRKLMKRGKRR